jgi:hypothetical protein
MRTLIDVLRACFFSDCFLITCTRTRVKQSRPRCAIGLVAAHASATRRLHAVTPSSTRKAASCPTGSLSSLDGTARCHSCRQRRSPFAAPLLARTRARGRIAGQKCPHRGS